ncbi:predicted protein [Naegleria gruberi]|uniref:Predicted protein n=1 Tax=Naegleria gruberi TaxID=5762 RepID=D2VCG2_NAEGR|nr:uncharacterized protein NAEGRDRAFT_66560 [Naegleria gruberi]EFC45301.1 predicted protein [Naegleria gruberi]|eukprot:XP_002678045.1 predicted protein [Naegleria gruberi strain NEG-M]
MSFIYNQVFWITPYGKGDSSNNFEYYRERIERAISNFNLHVLKFLVVPVLRIFPSLPLYPPFGIPCAQPKCRERFQNDALLYKGYWKSSTSISILEEMRSVKILLASFNPDQSQSTQNVPTLIVYGESDNFFSWDETKHLFSKHFQNITWKSYPNLKHDVFHEDVKEPVCRDLYNLVVRN